MKSKINRTAVIRRIAIGGLVVAATLSMGSMCTLLSLLGGSSASPTSTVASTFPTLAPLVTATATSAATVAPTVGTPATPTGTPSVAFLTSVSPSSQTQGLAINCMGGNLNGTNAVFLSGNFVGVTSPQQVAPYDPVTGYGFQATTDGVYVSFRLPNLGTVSTQVTVTISTLSQGFATMTDAFTYNP